MTAEAKKRPFDLIGTGVAALILSAIVTVLSILFSQLSNLASWQEAAFAIIVVMFAFLALAFLVVRFVSTQVFTRVDDLIDRFLVSDAAQRLGWLITTDRLKALEQQTDAQHIWIITRSLEEEVEQEQFGSVIVDNLKRGVCYTYFLPDDPALRARVARMRDIYRTGTLHFKMINSRLFDIISAQDMAIFGPEGTGAREMAGYMNLPIKAGGNDYFLVLGPTQAERIVGILSATESTTL